MLPFLQPLMRYATFTGRARRAEYWQFFLAQFILYAVLAVLAISSSSVTGMAMMLPVIGLVILALFLPNLAVTVRRLHDTGKSALWLLLYVPGFIDGFMSGFTNGLVNGAETAGVVPHAGNPVLAAIAGLCNLALFIMMCLPGNKGANRYGEDPKGGGLDIARIFDAPESEAPAEDGIPYAPVFDFSPAGKTQQRDAALAARGIPSPHEAPSAPVRTAPQTFGITPVRPTFGKRGL